MKKLAAWLIAAMVSILTANACTTFCLQHEEELVYGRNLDWYIDTGAVIINPRQMQKTAFVLPPELPLSWTSKYGSVTFNQVSREMPAGGMNEKGLVIECLVSLADYPEPDNRKALNELQWIQYHLDTCATVEEVLESAENLRIARYSLSLHYFIADANGNCAVVEFMDGKLSSTSGDKLPIKVLTNGSYLESLHFQKQTDGHGSSRFGTAAKMIQSYRGKPNSTKYAFKTLNKVAMGKGTKWQVVYDIKGQKIHFKTLKKNKIKTIDTAVINYDTAPLALDINNSHKKQVNKYFVPCTDAFNAALIERCRAAFAKQNIHRMLNDEHLDDIKRNVSACKKPENKQPEQ